MRNFVHEAMRRGWDRLALAEVEGLWSQIADHLASERFAIDWQSATPAEREVLLAIAREAGDTPITRRIGRSGTALLPRLLRKGLVVRSGRGEYQLYHPLFRSYVLGRG